MEIFFAHFLFKRFNFHTRMATHPQTKAHVQTSPSLVGLSTVHCGPVPVNSEMSVSYRFYFSVNLEDI